jgi:signal transduction histidine kinase
MLQIADRIAAVNERGLSRAEEQLAASSDGLRRSLVLTFGIALAGGLVLALLTIGYTLRLERELERRFDENARARADLQELSARLLRAQENERRTLARELHDEVGQSLSAILMEAESASCSEEPGEMRDHLAAIRTLAEKTVNEVRDLALLLRPSMLDDFGLVPALNWYAREITKRTGLNVVVEADDAADDLPDEHKTCIYRLVQEAGRIPYPPDQRRPPIAPGNTRFHSRSQEHVPLQSGQAFPGRLDGPVLHCVRPGGHRRR